MGVSISTKAELLIYAIAIAIVLLLSTGPIGSYLNLTMYPIWLVALAVIMAIVLIRDPLHQGRKKSS